MKSILKTSFILLFCVSVSFVIQAEDDWWPKLHFPKALYNQKDPRHFLYFVSLLQTRNLLVQEYIELKVNQQRNEAMIHYMKSIETSYLFALSQFKKSFRENNLNIDKTSATPCIIWEKPLSIEDKQIIKKIIDKSSLQGTVVIKHLDTSYARKNKAAAAAKLESIQNKFNYIILLPDSYTQKTTNEKNVIIAHEIKHLELLHTLEEVSFATILNLNPQQKKEIALERQIEFEADILANSQSFEMAQHFYLNYAKYKNRVLSTKDTIDRVHQLPEDSYHNSQIIFKLLAAQKAWFNTLQADEKYGQIAYEKAFETHYQKNNSFFNKLWSLKPF